MFLNEVKFKLQNPYTNHVGMFGIYFKPLVSFKHKYVWALNKNKGITQIRPQIVGVCDNALSGLSAISVMYKFY